MLPFCYLNVIVVVNDLAKFFKLGGYVSKYLWHLDLYLCLLLRKFYYLSYWNRNSSMDAFPCFIQHMHAHTYS